MDTLPLLIPFRSNAFNLSICDGLDVCDVPLPLIPLYLMLLDVWNNNCYFKAEMIIPELNTKYHKNIR